MSRRPSAARALAVLQAGALALGLGAATLPAAAPATAAPAQTSVVSDRPQAGPQVLDGTVYAITQVGDTVVAGGSFTSVRSPTSDPYARGRVVAWDTVTRTVSTTFAPQLNGSVRALLPGPAGTGTVYVAGEFSTVSGTAVKGLVRLRLSDGSIDPTFAPPRPNGVVDTLAQSGDRLYLGGTFTALGTTARGGLASVSATTGALDGVLASTVAGHHAWTPGSTGQVSAPVGVDRIAVTPDGSRLIAIGNFKTVDGQPRDQVAMWELPAGAGTAALRTWHPPRYDALCLKAYDSYVRGLDVSPDGSWFVITATGGRKTGSLCDSAARFETSGTGLDVVPTWVSTSGSDSLLSVAITGEAVYLGGHQRWLNNPFGGDVPGQGAVPRPGIGAVDPANGVPLSWNPGRHTRGAGTYALLATATGLWVGSDTNRLGHLPSVQAGKIGFFPLAGGAPAASKQPVPLPARVVTGAPGGGLVARDFDGTTATAASSVAAGLDVAQLRGTTVVGDTLFYGKADGALYERHVAPDGTLDTPEAEVDPYHDWYWSSVVNGSGPPIAPAGQTYDGVLPNFYADSAASPPTPGQVPSLTSLFYDPGTSKLFYTLTGRSDLFSRPFSPDVQRTAGKPTTGGVLFPGATTVNGVTLPEVTGAFLTGGALYYVKASDGSLNKVAFTGGRPAALSTAVAVAPGVDWRSRALFLLPPLAGPSAQATVTCSGLTCTADGSASTSPAGPITDHRWDWGDGSPAGSGPTAQHTYDTGGPRTVTLTVTDAAGRTATTERQVSPALSPVRFAGAGTAVSATTATVTVPLPAGVQAGDALVLAVSAVLGAEPPAPAGWSRVTGAVNGSGFLATTVWQRVATGTEGSAVSVPLGAAGKSVSQVLAYRGTAATSPVSAGAPVTETSTRLQHTAPPAQLVAGGWVVTAWTDKSSADTALQAPAGLEVRGRTRTPGSTFLTQLLVDDAGSGSAGSVPGRTATTAVASRANAVTLVLAPAS